jgi:hypothetical protein
VDLSIGASKNHGASINPRFNNIFILPLHKSSGWSALSQRREVDGYELEVNVAMYRVVDPYGEDYQQPPEVNIENMTEH